MKTSFLFLILLSAGCGNSKAARILGVFPHFGKSHYIMFEPMMEELAKRGHEVVVLTQFPKKQPLPNFKIVDLNGTIDMAYTNAVPVDLVSSEKLNLLDMPELAYMGIYNCEKVLPSKPVQDLLNSHQKFDLVFYEIFDADCFLGLVHKYKAPSIAVSSSSMMPWAPRVFGIPDNPSYVANHFTGLSDNMNFWERLWNTVNYVITLLVFSYLADGPNTALARKYFGSDMPSLNEIAGNTSLFFVNTHFSLNQVRSYPPNVIEVAGLHIKPPGKLDKELQTFLDDAKEGVVYFSLGSTARGASMSEEKRDAFLRAFRELPQKVLWKWEDDMPNVPANVKISKWLPQTAILAHPNVKVFMAHGGLMGMLEAVHYGVPMICFPLFGDQFNNVGMAVKRGIAVKVPFADMSYEMVKNALNALLLNSSYQENAKQVSQAFHDRPQTPMETFVYWTEYVLKYKGAPHLQSAAVHLPWVQYLLLDVITVLSIVALTIIGTVVIIIHCLCCGRKGKVKKSKQKQM